MRRIVVIFSGYNQRAILAFLRTLEDVHTQYAIVASGEKDEIFLTEYRDAVCAIRKQKELVLSDILYALQEVRSRKSADQYVIAPSTEALNRFLLKHREVFEGEDCTIPLVERNLYEEVSDKYSFYRLCQQNNINIPGEYSSINEIIFPCVAKPRTYFTDDSNTLTPVIIKEESDWQDFSRNFNEKDFFVQEYIDGRSLYLLYYFDKSGSVSKFSQENFVQQSGGKSIIAAVSSDVHQKDISRKFEKLFCDIGFRGLVMVEIKLYNGKYYMIEANPRFWGPSQLFVDAGVNLFQAFLFDNSILEKAPTYLESKVMYFWFGGILSATNSENIVNFHNYSAEDLVQNLYKWVNVDVYNREDTQNIFRKELSGRKYDK